MLEPGEYECANCHAHFHKEWTDEEAAQEFEQKFGRKPDPESEVLVCDDCYKILIGINEN